MRRRSGSSARSRGFARGASATRGIRRVGWACRAGQPASQRVRRGPDRRDEQGILTGERCGAGDGAGREGERASGGAECLHGSERRACGAVRGDGGRERRFGRASLSLASNTRHLSLPRPPAAILTRTCCSEHLASPSSQPAAPPEPPSLPLTSTPLGLAPRSHRCSCQVLAS